MFDDPGFYKTLIENLYDGIYFVDRNRRIIYWNKGAENITGYAASQVVGRRCRDNILNHVTENGLELCAANCPLAETMKDGERREASVYLHHADGHRVPVLVRASPIYNSQGDIVGAVETFSDNTRNIQMRRKNELLQKTVLLDSLTKLGNRRHVELRTQAELVVFHESGDTFGVIFFDIDHFKNINDTYGHAVGDQVLKMVATTIRQGLRATDTVGRWGGEEFVILVNGVTKSILETLAEKLRMLIEQSRLDIKNQSVRVTVSVGATLVIYGDTPDTLIQRADKLMYESKGSGRNRVTIG